MFVNLNMRQSGLFNTGGRAEQNKKTYGSWPGVQNAAEADRNVAAMRRMLRSGQTDDSSAFSQSIADQSASYAQSVRTAREKAKDTSLQKKKLHYNFKAISTQILRSKTSYNARQVASKARREVIRLKRQRQGGSYDDEELETAIVHAQAMERAAKKKARHLQEEEMVKISGGPCMAELEEREDLKNRETDEAMENALAAWNPLDGDSGTGLQSEISEAVQEQTESYRDVYQMQMAGLQELYADLAESFQEDMSAAMEDEMSEWMEEMSDSMSELLEEAGLEELSELVETVDVEMDPADYKLMKIKHRSEELRDIAKADAEYLKAVFNRLEKDRQSAAQGILNSQNSSTLVFASSGGVVSAGSGAVPARSIDVVSPSDAAASAPAESGGIDISV